MTRSNATRWTAIGLSAALLVAVAGQRAHGAERVLTTATLGGDTNAQP